MNLEILHSQFKDDDSPSVEGQIRWLQKQGFSQAQIDQAFILLYTDIEQYKFPKVFELYEGDNLIDTKYGPHDQDPPNHNYKVRTITNGFELDQCLLECAKIVRQTELKRLAKGIEVFEKKLRKRWARQVPWYKRIFGVKPGVEG